MPLTTRHDGLAPLVMFDGPNGAGKSTQIALAAQALRDAGQSVYVGRLNGGTPIGEALRKISRDPTLDRPVRTDLHIILATSFALAEVLRQHREQGELCLVDRSPLSIMAYQIQAGGLDEAEGRAAIAGVLAAFDPTLLICYSAPLVTLKARRQMLHDAPDFFESQPDSFAKLLIIGYEQAAKVYSASTIPATGTIDNVHAATMRLIKRQLT